MLSINENMALYALLGTEFGGDGRETFALPKLPPVKSGSGGDVAYFISLQGIFPPQVLRACLIIRFRAHSGSIRGVPCDYLSLQERKLGKSLFNNYGLSDNLVFICSCILPISYASVGF